MPMRLHPYPGKHPLSQINPHDMRLLFHWTRRL
jgi:hypothetical protein